MTHRILIVDDDPDHCTLLEATLTRLGYQVDSASSAVQALAMVERGVPAYNVILTDLGLQEMSGLVLCERLTELVPDVPVLAVTGDKTLESAIAALRSGAFDYVTKPVDAKTIGMNVARATHRWRVANELSRLKSSAQTLPGTLGESAAMRRTQEMIARVSRSDAAVLIQGETGSGKELVARAIHAGSARAAGPFVAINCAAMPASLLESELFGHARGAFTDAKTQREGLFVEASGGTLFLDEIGDMPLEMQSKLLRALQQRCVRPVGSNAEVAFDARIFAATHRDLEAEVAAGRFRQDLFYRINVVCVQIPPLRARDGDILRLADQFLKRFCAQAKRSEVRLSAQVAERLIAHDWPGNVRELENCMERLAALSRYDVAVLQDLPDSLRTARDDESHQAGSSLSSEGIVDLAALQRDHILRVLTQVEGNKSRAAQVLGLDRRTLYRKLEEYRRQGDDVMSASIETPLEPEPALATA
jgi:two-component system response regulator HydG